MKDPAFPKFVVFVNSAVPAALLLWDAATPNRLINKTEYLLHSTGMLALIFLMLSLAITPVRKITGWNWLSHFRRMLGLYAFFYACLHLICWGYFDRWYQISRMISDVFSSHARPFIIVGMISLGLMVPLAWTSTNDSIKRMGAARWKRLHRLAYLSAIAGVIHFWWLVKRDITQPLIFAGILTVLLGYRLVKYALPKLQSRPGASAAKSA